MALMRRSPIYRDIQMAIFKNKHDVLVQIREVAGLSLSLRPGTPTSQSLQANVRIVPRNRP
jgi:hypothetical protein